jgi:hypothetical protein
MSYRSFWHRRFLALGGAVTGLSPMLSTYHGLGIDPVSEQYIFEPHVNARVILVDGTTSSTGQIYHAATLAAGKALMRPGNFGDWLLFPAGGVTTTLIGEWPYLYPSTLAGGVDAQYPALIGTFDPTDPLNPTKWNKGERFKHDARGKGKGVGILYDQRSIAGTITNRVVVNQYFEAGLRDEGCWVGATIGTGGLLYDGCVFDRVVARHQTPAGAVNTGVAVPNWDRGPLFKNLTFNRCGFAYHNSPTDGRSGNTFEACVSFLSYQSCINHHGGWSEDHTRATPDAYSQQAAGTAVNDGVQLVFNFPNVYAHSLNTPNPVEVRRTLKTNSGVFTTLVAGTDYTLSFTRTDPITKGFTVTLAAPMANTHNVVIVPATAGADIYKHNWYIGAAPDGVVLYNNIGSWDSCNAKWASGLFFVKDHTEVHSGMGFIWIPYNGAAYKSDWPANGRFECDDFLQLGTIPYINTFSAVPRGHAGWITNGGPGTYFRNGVFLSNNGQAGTNGILVSSEDGCTATCEVSDTIFANWRFDAAELTATANSGLATRYFNRMIWDETSGGTNVNRATMTDTAKRDAIAQCLLRNVHTTFRIEQNIPVTVDADDMVTEDRVLAYMARNPTLKHWNKLLRAHILAPLGRS